MSSSKNASWAFIAGDLQTPQIHSNERQLMPIPPMPSHSRSLNQTGGPSCGRRRIEPPPHSLAHFPTGTSTFSTTPFTRNFPANDGLNHHHRPAVARHEAHEGLYANPARLLEAISAEEERHKRKEEVEATRAEVGLQRGQDRAQGPTCKRRVQSKTIKKDKGKGRAGAPASSLQVSQPPGTYAHDTHTGNGESAYPTPSGSGAQSPSGQALNDAAVESHFFSTLTHSRPNAQDSHFVCEQSTAQGTSSIHLLNVPDAVVPPAQTDQELSHVPGPTRSRRNGRRPVGPYPTANAESGKRYNLCTEENIMIITNRGAFHQKLLQHVQLAKHSHHEVMCRTDGCGVIIRGTRKDFEMHLNDNHPPGKICTWIDEESGPCRQEQSEPALQKRHIIDIHCRVWNSDCPECGQSFSRNDTTTIKRHNCPERTCWRCREVLASKPAYAAHARRCNAVGFSGPSGAGERERDEDPAVGPPMGIEDDVDGTQAPSFVAQSANPFAEYVSLTSRTDPTPAPNALYIGTSDLAGHLPAQPIDAFPDQLYASEEAQALTPSHVPNGGVLAPAQQAGDPGQDVLGSPTSSAPAYMSPYLPNDTTLGLSQHAFDPAEMHAQTQYYHDHFTSIHDGADEFSLESNLGISNYFDWDASNSMF